MIFWIMSSRLWQGSGKLFLEFVKGKLIAVIVGRRMCHLFGHFLFDGVGDVFIILTSSISSHSVSTSKHPTDASVSFLPCVGHLFSPFLAFVFNLILLNINGLGCSSQFHKFIGPCFYSILFVSNWGQLNGYTFFYQLLQFSILTFVNTTFDNSSFRTDSLEIKKSALRDIILGHMLQNFFFSVDGRQSIDKIFLSAENDDRCGREGAKNFVNMLKDRSDGDCAVEIGLSHNNGWKFVTLTLTYFFDHLNFNLVPYFIIIVDESIIGKADRIYKVIPWCHLGDTWGHDHCRFW